MQTLLRTFALAIFLFQPAMAAEIGDCHNAIEAAFPGKIFGVSGGVGNIERIHFKPGVTDQDKTQIQSFIQSFNWEQKNAQDVDKEIDAEMKKAADDKSLSDEEFEAKRVKLVRAKSMSAVSDKESKLEEVKKVKAIKP